MDQDGLEGTRSHPTQSIPRLCGNCAGNGLVSLPRDECLCFCIPGGASPHLWVFSAVGVLQGIRDIARATEVPVPWEPCPSLEQQLSRASGRAATQLWLDMNLEGQSPGSSALGPLQQGLKVHSDREG